MDPRSLGTTGFDVSETALGTWQLGGSWGLVTNDEAHGVIEVMLDAGIDFLDTTDVHGDGDSERRIGDVLADRDDDAAVAIKAGRRFDPHGVDGYDREDLGRFVYRSRDSLGVDSLDLVQLHRPPREVYYQPEVFDALSELRDAGKIDHYGVNVGKVEEGLKAIEYDGMETVQIIFNPLRQRPVELFFREATHRSAGVIVRIPPASGLPTGTLSTDTKFAENDHRNFNRYGEALDVGETFAGVPFGDGFEAAGSIQEVVPEGVSLAQFTLRWILSFDVVSTVIPGPGTSEHIRDNVAVASFPPLSIDQFERIEEVYNAYAREHAHHRWWLETAAEPPASLYSSTASPIKF